MKVFGKEFDEGSIGFAVVRFGAEINGVFVRRDLDDFFLAGAGFDGNL